MGVPGRRRARIQVRAALEPDRRVHTSLDNREESGIRSQGPAPVTNAFILVNPGGTDFQRSEKFEFQAVRFALNYRF